MNNNSNKNAHHQHYGNREFSLFVGDLPYDCSDDKLQHLYQSRFKSVKRVQIIRAEDGSSRGFGFIRFEELAEFEKALAEGMKIDNTTLRVDTAHRNYKNRSRYGSFNSTGSNNSNHHNHHQFNNNNSNLHHQHHHQHHHNQSHHHPHPSQTQSHQQHGSQQHHPPNQQQGQNNNKILMTDQNVGGQPLSQGSSHQGAHSSSGASSNASPRVNKGPMHMSGMGVGGSGQGNQTAGAQHSHTHQQQSNQLHNQHNAHLNHNLFNSSQQKMNQHHTGSETRGSKQQQQQPNHSQGGDEATKSMAPTQNKPPTRSSPHQPSPQQAQSTPLPQPAQAQQQNLTQMNNNNNAIGVAVPSANTSITATTTSATSLSSSDISHSTSVLPNSQLNINAGQPSLGPDLRGYAHATMMDNPHMMGATEPSVMPPSSVYGHIYPYGPPPPFGYMAPPPQPNPVIPISAVPPAPPNQASSSGVGQQHSMASAGASGGGRYNSGHHQQQQHHPHQAQQTHASALDANAMNSMSAAGVQGPPTHQAPFYYYYPSPLYFDQTGAAAPPNLYHPQSFHPQFFALPNPAYLPNAHTYTNQHQTQPPLASQSDASATLVNQQQPQQPQSHQQQVNLRTRDIDAPIE